MTIGIVTAVRNSRASKIIDALDDSNPPHEEGHLMLYKGTRPATGAAPGAGDLLVQFDLAAPCGTVANGVLTFSAITSKTGLATGRPTWGRFTDGDENPVLDGDVDISSALIIMEEDPDAAGEVKQVFTGGLVSIVSASLTEGNA